MRLPLLLPGALAALDPLERVLIDTPEPQLLRSHMYNITRFDHLMASPGDHANARYVRDELRRLGFDAEIQEVPVMTHLPAGPPTLSAVEGGAVVYEAKLAEDVLAADPTSDNWYRNMTFNAYAPSGDVAAPIVVPGVAPLRIPDPTRPANPRSTRTLGCRATSTRSRPRASTCGARSR